MITTIIEFRNGELRITDENNILGLSDEIENTQDEELFLDEEAQSELSVLRENGF